MSEIKMLMGIPSEKQKLFLEATERYVAYGGARGGGKSWAVRCKATLLALNYPGCRILILRRTLPELRENHIRPLCGMLKETAIYNESKKSFLFSNGSLLLCGYCAKEKDLFRYQGQEFDFIFIDEATHMEEMVFTALKGCLRGINGYPKRMYLTCNPGGVGHSWVKRLFIDRKFKKGENPSDYRFIPAKLSDNKILEERDPDYLEALLSLPADLRKAWLDGCWDLFEGQFFEEFSREIHTVEPFPLPPECMRYMAFDYGLDMLACLWFAVFSDGRIYVYRELHESGLIVSEAAAKMLEYSRGEKIRQIYMPPDMASRQKDSGLTMEELFMRNGISGIAADNRRVPGWLAVKELLNPLPDAFGGKTPRLRIFKHCTVLISHLPALLRDSKNGSDASVHPHEITHICDALRYFALSYRQMPLKKKDGENAEIEKRMKKALRNFKAGQRKSRF